MADHTESTVRDVSKVAQRRHPEYDERKIHWEFLEACYEGGRSWFDTNIFKYIKEGEQEFKERVKRAFRFNHTREVVDLVNKYVFRTKVSRNEEDAPNSIKKFWKSATSEGYDIDYLMAQICKRTSISGRIYIVVDNTATEGTVTKEDEDEEDIKTYAYWVGPQDALDMSFDSLGNLNWILLREKYRNDADPFGESQNQSEQFRLWTKTGWQLFRYVKQEENTAVSSDKDNKKKVEIYQTGMHNLGKVPVIIVDHMDSDNPYSSPALINDIAYQDRAVANYLSNLDAIIQDQTFSQLVLPAQGLMPGEEEKAKEKLTEMGTSRIFLFNGEGGMAPAYISPDPQQAELIITAIRTIINEIYHTVGMAGERTKEDNSMGIDNSSGVAKAYDFERVNALLINKSKALSKAENEILTLVALWNTEEHNPDHVVWADNFDVRGLADEFDIASSLSLISAPDTVRKEQMKMLVDKLFPTISDELKKKMFGEIDSDDWPPAPEQFAFGGETADNGNNGSADDDDDD